jgi:predicted regulator of Ras-like GTPase activity (Roadblock/LC7/MglB family)
MLKQKTNDENAASSLDVIGALTIGAENDDFSALNASLMEIRKLKGVLGYLLRNNTSAVIDLTEQDKLCEYALLSFKIHESGLDVAKQFKLGETESVLVEGKDMKVLCMSIGENKISVFMEKAATHAWIIKRILL